MGNCEVQKQGHHRAVIKGNKSESEDLVQGDGTLRLDKPLNRGTLVSRRNPGKAGMRTTNLSRLVVTVRSPNKKKNLGAAEAAAQAYRLSGSRWDNGHPTGFGQLFSSSAVASSAGSDTTDHCDLP